MNTNLSRRKLSAVPWLMIRKRKQFESRWSLSSVSFLLTEFIPWLVRFRYISTSNPGDRDVSCDVYD